MQFRQLGRTGLKVSLLGLGSGGASRLGQRYNLSTDETDRLVKHALDVGVNVIDTAPTYSHSEALLGQALRGVPRDQYVLCTKFQPHKTASALHDSAELRSSLEDSLRALLPLAQTHEVGLTGTASLDHFDANLHAILGPPLPPGKLQRVQDVFGPVKRNVQPERVRA